jgi:hypothetical protein
MPRRLGRRQSFALFVAALIAGGLTINVALKRMFNIPSLGSGAPASSPLSSLMNTAVEEIDGILIRHPGGTEVELMLDKAAGRWLVRTQGGWLPVSQRRQSLLFHSPSGVVELGSDINMLFQGENQGDLDLFFGIGEELGRRVSFSRGGEVVDELVIGARNATRRGHSTFVRRGNSRAVHVVEANLGDNFAARSAEEWVEGKLVGLLDPAAIAWIELQDWARDARFRLVPAASQQGIEWFVQHQQRLVPARPEAVESLLVQLAGLDLVEFLGAGEEWDGPGLSVRVHFLDAREPVLLTFRAAPRRGTSLRVARVGGSEQLVLTQRLFSAERPVEEFLAVRPGTAG